MTRRPIATLIAVFAAALPLAACGTSNSASTIETVTVTHTATSTAASAPTASTSTLPAGGGTPGPGSSSTRTATAPGFTGGASASGSPAGAQSAAVAKLRALGFTPLDTSTYHSDQTLRVLIGARTGSADERTQRAFFFNGARYLGTDTADTSAEIRVDSQSDTEVTLSYGIYRRSDPLCCPRGGTRMVRFQLDMGRLAPIDPLPSASERQ